ncbi:MAG: M14 family zinc carboxypeptidase [Gammaproteobacteria bacterium]
MNVLTFAKTGAALALLLAANTSSAVCLFDGAGLITNPDDPACSERRFEITESDTGADSLALGYPVPIPVDSMTAVDGFRAYASLHAQHQALFLASDNIQGRIVGQTLAGRDIWAYQLGDADALTVDGRAEPAVMLNGTIHAREWQSPEVVTEVFEQLNEISTDGGFGQYLAENLNVVIVPVLNVDGFLQTQRFPISVAATQQQPRDGRMRRKNMRLPSGAGLVDESIDTSAGQFDGVDLNRNSVHGHGLNNGSSSNPISLVYRGSAAASEPEIQALIQAATLGPGNRLRFYVDAHSFTRQFFVPSTTNFRRNAITQSLAERMRAALNFRYFVNVDPVGTQIGTTADYFAIEFQVPSWTLEIEPRAGGQDYGGTDQSHSGFVLPDSEIARVRDEVTLMMLLGYYRQSGPPAVKAAQINRVSDGATMYRADWQQTAGAATRTLAVSVDEALLAGEEYDLWVGFTKPMRYSEDGISAVRFNGQSATDIGAVSLDAGAAEDAAQFPITGDLSNWLSTPGGAPSGFDTYKFDAFSTRFTAPTVSNSSAFSLALDVPDLSQLALDANPATVVDWQTGNWTGYDDEFGDTGDSGGADCGLTVRVTVSGMTAPAAGSVACKASFVAAPTPVTPPLVTPQSSGGGGAVGYLSLLALLGARRRRRL